MNSFRTKLILLCLIASFLRLVHSQGDCQSITIGVLGDTTAETSTGLISEILTPGGEAQDGPEVRVIDFTIVCEAQATMQDRYRYTSVVVSYTCSSIDLRVTQCQTPGQVNTDQFDLGCTDPPDNKWTRVILTNSLFAVTTDPSATLSTSLESRCGICGNPNHPFLTSATIEMDTHCERCSGCTEGLMRCTERETGNCCNYFEQGLCVEQCTSPLVPNSEFECVCPELSVLNGVVTYTDDQEFGSTATLTCDDGYPADGPDTSAVCSVTGWNPSITECTIVNCGGLTAPVNGEITITTTTYLSTATYTCNAGHVLEGDSSRMCMSDAQWSGSDPTCTDCNGKIDMCIDCEVDSTLPSGYKCLECADPLVLIGNECKEEDASPSTQGGNCDIGCIIGIILAILAVIVIAVVVAIVVFVLYKYLNDPATKLAKTDTAGLNGVARDNPLYVDPSTVVEEGVDAPIENGVSETTPLESGEV